MWRFLFPLIKLNNSLSSIPTIDINIDLKVPYQSALPGDCGAACVYMITKQSGFIKDSFKDFLAKYKNKNNYQEPIGWNHKGLIAILKKHKIQAKKEKYKSTRDLINKLNQTQKPIIASVFVPSSTNLSASKLFQRKDKSESLEKHLIIVKGIENNHLITHDPRNIYQYTHDFKIPIKVFNKIFTGNYIYTK